MEQPYTDEDLIRKRDSVYFYEAVSVVKKSKQERPEELSFDPKAWRHYNSFMKKTQDLEQHGVIPISRECADSFLSTLFSLLKNGVVDTDKTLSKKLYEEINEPFRIIATLNFSGFKNFFSDLEIPNTRVECFKGQLTVDASDKCIWTNEVVKKNSRFFVYSICPSGAAATKLYPVTYKKTHEKELRLSVINSLIFSFKIEEYILSEIKSLKNSSEITESDDFACKTFFNICTFNTILKKAFKDF